LAIDQSNLMLDNKGGLMTKVNISLCSVTAYYRPMAQGDATGDHAASPSTQ
jgi:hypothetical protein